MPEITFVFGPNNTFFFDCPKTWKFHGIPQTLRQLFNSSMGPAWRIAQPYCVGLAPQVNSPEPLWYVGCKTLNGEDKLFYSQTYFDVNYADLARWTKSFPNAPRLCFVTFGQNLSYFASAPGHGSIWGGIPSELEDKVRKAFDTPCCVALGQKNAWLVLYPDGYIAWKFYGHYSALDKILKDAAPQSVSYVALSPYHKEHYFVAFKDRSIKYNFTGAPPEWMRLMTEVFDAWAAERLQKPTQSYFQPVPSPYPQSQPYPQAHAYSPPAQPYLPQTQPYSPPVQPYLPQTQPYPPQAQPYPQGQPYQNSPPPFPSANPLSPPLTPLPLYTSPVPQNAMPVPVYGYRAPQGGAIEMPAELPGQVPLSAPAPVPVRSGSTDKKKRKKEILSKMWFDFSL
ncbi:uncharacterized protein K460DRAFT_370340 [Cucurbitaria berberidis CBS 394.84]|uniref:Uncharacterized protein n=1 Tax=Cucurbitaria berberidis CBS 394.84 TaxID=1168544 RepID=A0A9P4GB49_9PLEO|nr:uncharacterized protein K460DRAFT_370340 [Cucurbitaria berberidis CBS 394.84]KAF1842372.1 hypothetical protein K460DRAFT_370340 [Cucurbitaria berberidis CBS 394.84]